MNKYWYVCPSCGKTVYKINKDGECSSCAKWARTHHIFDKTDSCEKHILNKYIKGGKV